MDAKIEIKVDDDVPMPPGAPPLRFPMLEKMSIGQSFAVPKEQERSLRGCIQFMQMKHEGRKLTARTWDNDTIRCWRIA